MWRKATKNEEDSYLSLAISFTGDHKIYGSYMRRVVHEWPVACEHNLTDLSQNRKAWIGHAAICLANGCPEYITRAAWAHLSSEQQRLANGEAQRAIDNWELLYSESKCLRLF
jgi:hypothetical protein